MYATLLFGVAFLARISNAVDSFTITARGDTGEEQMKFVVGGESRVVTMTTYDQDFVFDKPISGEFTISLLNDNGPNNGRVKVSLPVDVYFHAWTNWNCGAADENHRCQMVRDGFLGWGGEYKYTFAPRICVVASVGAQCPQMTLKQLNRLTAEKAALEANFQGSFADCVAHVETLKWQGAGAVKYFDVNGVTKCESWVVRNCHNFGVAPEFCPAPTPPPTYQNTGLRCGSSACVSYYNDISGTTLDRLKFAFKFPIMPDEKLPLAKLELPEDKRDNYGVLLEAWVKAPTTGDYVFSTQSDDASAVWISTTPGVVQTEAEMTKVVELTSCCRKVTGTTKVSLEAGKSYYLMGYMKEGLGKDYFTVGMTVNGKEYWPIQESDYELESTLGYVDPSVPAPVCENTGSQYTQALLGKMDTAQQKFGECADDIAGIAGTLGKLSTASTVIKKIVEYIDQIVSKVDNVFDNIMKTKIADVLGKIPKIGIFIKMGIKAMNKVLDALEPLFNLIKKWAGRVDQAVYITSTSFKAMRVVATPTSWYLSGSHSVLKTAHECAEATTGYGCGTAGARLEAENKESYSTAKEQLEAIADTGAACHTVLNPMEQVMKVIAMIAEKIEKLLEPIKEILDAVVDWVEEMNKQIQKFVDALSESAGAQCAMEIFMEPGSDLINLITCPVDELVGAFMHFVVDQLILKAGLALQKATNDGITNAVDALVPDNLELTIPDFTVILPTATWFKFCENAAIVSPTMSNKIKEIQALNLPYKITGKDLENEILSKALIKTDLTMDLGEYESACVEAWNEFGTDFENCKKVLEDIEKAAKFAACETAKFAHQANQEAVSGAISASNAARSHFNSAQSDFQAAKRHLNEVQGDLDAAKRSLEDSKNDCPSCRCGGCSWHDVGCHVESAWCCPARHTCLLALDIAKGGVDAAKGSVSVAQGSVHAASVTYHAAENELRKAEQDLAYYQNISAESAKVVAQDCNRRREEALELKAPSAESLPPPVEIRRASADSLGQDEE